MEFTLPRSRTTSSSVADAAVAVLREQGREEITGEMQSLIDDILYRYSPSKYHTTYEPTRRWNKLAQSLDQDDRFHKSLITDSSSRWSKRYTLIG